MTAGMDAGVGAWSLVQDAALAGVKLQTLLTKPKAETGREKVGTPATAAWAGPASSGPACWAKPVVAGLTELSRRVPTGAAAAGGEVSV